MEHQKSERVAYLIGIRNFQSFSLAETQKFSFFPAALVSRTDSRSVVDAQNSVTSKSLVGRGCMITDRKMEEFPKFLVFSSGAEF
jgi:hypothetical protein